MICQYTPIIDEHILMQISIRQAQPSDKSAIIHISKGVYDQFVLGYDYLPPNYDAWIQDPNKNCYVLIVDGNVVGFRAVTVMDNGKTLWIEGARVLESLRGGGLGTKLAKETDQMGREKYPKAIRFRWSSVFFPKNNPALYSCYTWAIIPNKISSVLQKIAAVLKEDVKETHSSDIYEFLVKRSTSCFTKSNTFCTVWKHYELSKENIKVLDKNHKLFQDNNGVSWGCDYKRNLGLSWEFTVDANDHDSMLRHLSTHFKLGADRKCITVTFAGEWYEKLQELKEWFGNDLTEMKQGLFEVPIKQNKI